jgi:hypothetical protein
MWIKNIIKTIVSILRSPITFVLAAYLSLFIVVTAWVSDVPQIVLPDLGFTLITSPSHATCSVPLPDCLS